MDSVGTGFGLAGPDIRDTSSGVRSLYYSGVRRRMGLIVLLAIILFFLALVAAGTGTVSISPADTVLAVLSGVAPGMFAAPSHPQASLIILNFRLPRILLAILAGTSLAVAGTVMQGLLRNPLVSPFTLGLSSAASFGAAVAIVIGPAFIAPFWLFGDNAFIITCAFLAGWASMMLVYSISRSRGTDQATLILAGVVIGYIFQAGVLGLKYLTDNEKLRELVVWLMGGMWGASWSAVLLLVPITVLCCIALELKAWDMNALVAGDDVARNAGIDVRKLRFRGLMTATFAASACLAFTGIIGFIGLMAPHICRMIIGADHRYLIPCAGMMGAIILLGSDTVARVILSPIEIPVGIIMYVIGGGFFLFLILKGRGHGLY